MGRGKLTKTGRTSQSCQIQCCGWHVSVEVGSEVPGLRLLRPELGSSDTAAAPLCHCCRPPRLPNDFVQVERQIVQHRHRSPRHSPSCWRNARSAAGSSMGVLIRCNAGGPLGAAPRLSPCCRGRPQRANFQALVPYLSTGGTASNSWPRTTRMDVRERRHNQFLESDVLRAAAEGFQA